MLPAKFGPLSQRIRTNRAFTKFGCESAFPRAPPPPCALATCAGWYEATPDRPFKPS